MTPELSDLIKLAGYVVAGRLVIKYLKGNLREIVFALLNLGLIYRLFFNGPDHRYVSTFIAYLGLVAFQYFMLRLFAEGSGSKPWLAFFTPILALVFLRYVPGSLYNSNSSPYAPYFIGVSYLAFRCSHLVFEVQNAVVRKPSFFEYLNFCFFVPTMSLGPINPYSNFRRAFEPEPPSFSTPRALLRILVGMVKYKIIGNILFQLTYANFLLDKHYHHWIDLPIAAVAYGLFLYNNFSGFCDMAIGCAALMGIPVIENFNRPFVARNFREFWNRWHISLSAYMRDVCFSPMSKFLARLLGPNQVNQAVAISIMVVFILIGIWHGTGWNFVVFGFLQGIGVVTTHYYTIGLKRWLDRDGFKAYNANPWIHALAVSITFSYFVFTLFFFANSPDRIQAILSVIR